jgi:endonuclease/exonuclease/phosphatase family metal-dependent hydrolase
MVPHPKPTPPYSYDIDEELDALVEYRNTAEGRQIPAKSDETLLIATWNLTNFGLQERYDSDYHLMSEIISWFDIVAVQEIAEDLNGLRKVLNNLQSYRAVVSDPGGNDERLGFIYNRDKVKLMELVGEVAVPPSDHRYIRMKNVSGTFTGFDRNPYLSAFEVGNIQFIVVSVHLYFGKNRWFDIDRRTLETFAIARWAHLRHKSSLSYSSNIFVLGDFNLEKRAKKDKVFKALKSKGLFLPDHTTKTGSNLEGDKEYDQIAFFPGTIKKRFTGNAGVFDFDGGIFKKAWDIRRTDFQSIIKFHIADHRPLWAEFNIQS